MDNLSVWEKTLRNILHFLYQLKKLDNGKTITYKSKFIDSFRFLSTSLSSLVNNLSDGLHNGK